jgi:hypothetical protein
MDVEESLSPERRSASLGRRLLVSTGLLQTETYTFGARQATAVAPKCEHESPAAITHEFTVVYALESVSPQVQTKRHNGIPLGDGPLFYSISVPVGSFPRRIVEPQRSGIIWMRDGLLEGGLDCCVIVFSPRADQNVRDVIDSADLLVTKKLSESPLL